MAALSIIKAYRWKQLCKMNQGLHTLEFVGNIPVIVLSPNVHKDFCWAWSLMESFMNHRIFS